MNAPEILKCLYYIGVQLIYNVVLASAGPQSDPIIHTHVRVCCVCHLSRVQLFATPWTVAPQASLSVGFPRQEY